jgi:16S rRNA C967 or C1407 C5-methylase (RsmB/RsmF family)/NOL1/NOP2/fmu family ribosome biogenesis protein
MQLPEKFIQRMQRELGDDEAQALCSSLLTEPSTSVRLNPYKMAAPKWADAMPVPWSEDGYRLSERPSFTLDAAFHAGAYYVQEASSQFAGYILREALGGEAKARGCRVLDVCAAPGGKSTHYASIVGTEGLVVANEINRSRAAVLADNARKWGLGNMVVSCNDSSRLAQLVEWFDAVAVDAPCSGEGMFRKLDEAQEQWSEANVAMCAERQWEILQNAYEALRPGGVLIYSTCTFNRSEDEEILQRAMQQWGEELEAVDDIAVDERWGVVEGREGVFHTYRFFPHKVAGEGMFMAVARKGGSNMTRRHTPKSRRQIISKVEKRDVAELSRWVREPEQMQFFVAGEMIYGCRKEHFADIEMLSGVLSVIYSGVAMGQIFKGRLKPDGALAMWVGFRREVVECRSLAQEQVLQFLRKQEVSASLFAEGLNLVEYEGLSLGFVKRIGGRVNNLYSNSLRILK